MGLILPGTVMMAGLGALIGGGEVNFWQAWLAGIVGCLLGDWISFWLGWRFKEAVAPLVVYEENRALLEKTEHALHQHSMITILIGRFVGPTRPLVPMVAGMLDLPVAKFVLPNIIGCLLYRRSISFRASSPGRRLIFRLMKTAPALNGCYWGGAAGWLAGWLCWRLWRSAKTSGDRLTR